MSSIHLAAPDRSQTVHEEADLRELWNRGSLGADYLYWREGMAEWRPITELFAAEPPPPAFLPAPTAFAAPPIVSATMLPRGFYKDPTGMTRFLTVLLWIGMGLSATAMLLEGVSLATGQATVISEELNPMDIVTAIFGLLRLPCIILTGVIFLMWIFRANKNVRSLGATDLQFTAGWAVGYYFIPIMNLWKPYQAMKEIWQASKNPMAWRAQEPPALLSLWWGSWLISNICDNLSLRLAFAANSPGELMASSVVSLLSETLGIILCFIAIKLVRSIYQMQRAWAAQPQASCCAVCQKPMAQGDMVFLNNIYVCANCKPYIIQQMAEGARAS